MANAAHEELREKNERLRKLLEEAYDIIKDHAPGFTVWLESAESELDNSLSMEKS